MFLIKVGIFCQKFSAGGSIVRGTLCYYQKYNLVFDQAVTLSELLEEALAANIKVQFIKLSPQYFLLLTRTRCSEFSNEI